MRAAAGAEADSKAVAARIFVCPSEDAAAVRAIGRRAIAAYLNVTVYAEFHRWLGRAPALQGMWDAWQAGDRKAALAAIDDDLVDQLIVHGSPAACREQIRRYVARRGHGADHRPDRAVRGPGSRSPRARPGRLTAARG